jgi:hypothetical protein
MATKVDLENKVEYLEKELNDMRDAFRRLAQQNSDYLAMLGKVQEEVNKLRSDMVRKEQEQGVKTFRETGMVNRYE